MKKILLLACVAAIACGDDDVQPMADAGMMDGGGLDVPALPDTGPGPDAGPTPDGGPVTPDAGPGSDDICDPGNLENVTASADMIVSTTIDTSTATATPVELGAQCGSELTGQIVVAVTVPGADANQIIRVSTENDGTEDIDTILEFRTDCATVGVCFDDTDESLLSAGTIIADGGSTVYALISGYGADDQGTIEVTTEILGTAGGVGDACDEIAICGNGLLCNADAVCETAEPPVLTAAEVVRYDNVGEGDAETELEMGLTGTDPNGDVVSFSFTFLDAADAPFDFFGDGEPPTFEFGLEDAAGMASFMEAVLIGANATEDYPDGAVRFSITLNDSAGLSSEPVLGDIITRDYSEAGESCEFTTRCDPEMELVCGVSELCEAPAAPVLTAATMVRYDDADFDGDVLTILGLGLSGDDSNGDVVAFNFALLDAADEVVEIEGLSPEAFGFDEVTGLATFMEGVFLSGGETSAFPAEAVRFRISLIDGTELESEEVMGDITAGTLSVADEACGFTEFCDPAAMLFCNDADICEVDAP